MSQRIDRRDFVKTASTAAAGIILSGPMTASPNNSSRRRYAIVGTGYRATGMWGKDRAARYANEVEFVGLCDNNRKRVEA